MLAFALSRLYDVFKTFQLGDRYKSLVKSFFGGAGGSTKDG
jgi:hypothetical protein